MSGASRWRSGARTLTLTLALCAPVLVPAQQISVQTSGEGSLITVLAVAEMQVDPRTAWNVISDYDHLAEFIPEMRRSRVIERHGDKVLIEQAGLFTFLVFRQPVEVRLALVETPPRGIEARVVSGNLKQMDGRYTLEELPAGKVRLSYSGRVVPDFFVPPIIGKVIVRSVLTRQFTALVKEILRRDALAKPTANAAGRDRTSAASR